MTNRLFTMQIQDKEERYNYRKQRYELAQIKKIEVKNLPLQYDVQESLFLLKSLYKILKENHNDIPRFRDNLIKLPNKSCSLREAHCHQDKKQICFSMHYLKRLACLQYDDLNDNWLCTSGLFNMCYLLAHETAHFKIKGSHNQRFYKVYHRLHDTLINMIISGELYMRLNP